MTRDQKKYLFCILLSLLFHWVFFWLIPLQVEDEVASETEALDVMLLKKYRIADIQKPKKEERPDRADFLGRYDSRVEEERVAPSKVQPGSPSQPSVAQKMQEQETLEAEESLAARYAMRSRETKRSAQQAPQQQKPRGAFPEDFFPDYKVGPHTYLNVLRFSDVEYFVRLKRVFKMTFAPVPALRGAYRANQISRGQIEVVLGVAIDANGKLAKLFVINGSGLGSYDAEALRTVRESAPFARPPTQLLDQGQLLRMSWTFTVYL